MALLAGGRFVAELGLLVALGVVGWRVADASATWTRVGAAVLLPVAGAAVWGRWVAPRAARRLPDPSRLGVEVVLFGGAAAGLVSVGASAWAVALGSLWLATAFAGRKDY
jgi:hypothetical protein